MEMEIDIADLQKRKLLIATPCYGGMNHGFFTKSCVDLSKLCAKYNIEIDYFFLFNESLITRARNYCVDTFLRSDFTHLMFIDSDIGFNPHDVISLLALSDPESEYDILCGPYPKKTISWEKIKLAVDKGFADKNPQDLSRFVGDYVFNPAEGKTEIPLNVPAEVQEGGTGFMMIHRAVFEKYAEAYPELKYSPDHVRSKDFDGSREITAFFDTVIHEGRYLSEDYMFCVWARKIGLKVWMCPWMQLTHTGSYTFGGSLADLAVIGAAGTADSKEKIHQ